MFNIDLDQARQILREIEEDEVNPDVWEEELPTVDAVLYHHAKSGDPIKAMTIKEMLGEVVKDSDYKKDISQSFTLIYKFEPVIAPYLRVEFDNGERCISPDKIREPRKYKVHNTACGNLITSTVCGFKEEIVVAEFVCDKVIFLSNYFTLLIEYIETNFKLNDVEVSRLIKSGKWITGQIIPTIMFNEIVYHLLEKDINLKS